MRVHVGRYTSFWNDCISSGLRGCMLIEQVMPAHGTLHTAHCSLIAVPDSTALPFLLGLHIESVLWDTGGVLWDTGGVLRRKAFDKRGEGRAVRWSAIRWPLISADVRPSDDVIALAGWD